MLHKGEVITPSLDVILSEGDVLLFVTPKKLIEK